MSTSAAEFAITRSLRSFTKGGCSVPRVGCSCSRAVVACPWCDFDFDTAVALAHNEARLVVRRRAIQHAAVVEGELGSMPRTADRPVFQRALRQGTSEVRTR